MTNPWTMQRPPARVTAALSALGTAFLVSASALAVNHLVYLGAGIGPGPGAGIFSLAVQALAIALVARANPVGRVLVIFTAVLSTLPLPMLARLVSERSFVSAAYIGGAFAFKAIAVWLLYSGASKDWFKSR
ncbi:MAG TPA: hypothetical protein VGJ18_18215 [Gemmatimonadaceae bacterium]